MESSISKIFGGIPDVDGQGLGSQKKLQRSSAPVMQLGNGLVLHGSLKVLGSRARNRTSSRMGSGSDVPGHMVGH